MGLTRGRAPGVALTLLLSSRTSVEKLNYNPSPQGSWGANRLSLPPLGIALALPVFTYLLIVLAGKARGRKYKK